MTTQANANRKIYKAVLTVSCPRCPAGPGNPCQTPRGRELTVPHSDRCRMFKVLGGK